MNGHRPVLLNESLRALAVRRAGNYLDATFGGGGHARAILEASETVHLFALDRDPEAATRAKALSLDFPRRFSFFQINFSELATLDLPPLDGALFDFGVSSYHLDAPERGFSFAKDAPLDMRMDPTEGASAAAFLEKCSRDELVRAIRDLGEEKAWKRIVGAIWRARGTGRLGRTASLASLIADAAGPAWQRKSKLHPATLSFQGIRMAVNAELEAIEAAVPVAFAKLADEGRLVAISFHSLEDRLVKRLFREFAGRPVDRFDNRFQQDRSAQAELLTNRPIQPTPEEIAENPRSRSSRLRALRKLPVS